MNDFQVLVCAFMGLTFAVAAGLLRGAAQQVHYSERRRFWQSVAPVLLLAGAGLSLAALALQGWVDDAFLWLAASLALMSGAASYWVELDPQRVLAWRRVRR